MSVFARHAYEYADADLPVFPVDCQAKRPAIRGWQNATPQKVRRWARVEHLGKADGIGLLMGPTSRITEIDIDAEGEAWLGIAIEKFGETPIVIKTASGKSKLWYRHNNETRLIRPFGSAPIDLLGGGFSIAPPSVRRDLEASYEFSAGGLADIAHLPSANLASFNRNHSPHQISEGERNLAVFRESMLQARHCDDFEALVDKMQTWAGAFPKPLSPEEVSKCARSAWRYQEEGRNFLGLRRPQVTSEDVEMDDLIDEPQAYSLLLIFKRWHRNRASFAIAPDAMSRAGRPPWSRGRISRARDILLERGYLIQLEKPVRGRRSGRYCISTPH